MVVEEQIPKQRHTHNIHNNIASPGRSALLDTELVGEVVLRPYAFRDTDEIIFVVIFRVLKGKNEGILRLFPRIEVFIYFCAVKMRKVRVLELKQD